MQLSFSLKSMKSDENKTCQKLQDTGMRKSFVEVVALRKAIFDGCEDKI